MKFVKSVNYYVILIYKQNKDNYQKINKTGYDDISIEGT
jgi:hypothetical protein